MLAFWVLTFALDLRAVQGSAQAHFPAILAAEQEIAQAQGEQLAAAGGFDPSLTGRAVGDVLGYYRDVIVDAQLEQATPLWGTSFIAGYRLGRGTFPDYAGGLITNAYGEVRGAVNVPLLRNGWTDRRRANVARADLALDASAAQKQQTLLEVTRAASVRYYTWVGAGLRRTLNAQLLSLAKERDMQITRRVQSGDLPEIERIDNARIIAQREALLVQADRQLQQAALELSLYLRDTSGRPRIPTLAELPASIEPPAADTVPVAALTEQALQARPDLARNALVLRQSIIERDVQKNQFLPAVDFRVVASQDLGPGSPTRTPFELSVGVYLDVPLAFRLQRGRTQAAEAAVSRGETLLQLQRERIAVEVQDAKSAELAGIERFAAARREAELAMEIARLERARFGLGESTLFVVNLRETAAVEAQARAIDAAVEAQRAAIDLATVTGVLVAPGRS